jgi:sialidase-1
VLPTLLAPGGSGLLAAEAGVVRDLFVGGQGGYHTYRIPSLLVTPNRTLLAICEGRKESKIDQGDIDLVLRRSANNGKTWSPVELLYEEGENRPITIGNPCPVVDARTGTIVLAFCRDNDEVFIITSQDDGQTWSKPRDITPQVKPPKWGWYATGPGVGIQLQRGAHAGRLVIPCDHSQVINTRRVMFSHVIFSDDGGETWRVGGKIDRHTDECQVVELADGQLMLNMRNYWGRDGSRPDRANRRAVSTSADGGATWSELSFDATLVEPVCQASLIAVPNPNETGKLLLLFSNPATTNVRRNMTVRVSFDEGKSWPVAREIDAGHSAYSCLAHLPNGQIGLLYERDDYSALRFLAFDLNRLLQPAPTP